LKTYLVGGAVRDQLLGHPVKEKDYVVVGATPKQMLMQKFRLVGKDFPVFLHPETNDEYALARTERKIGPGYKGFACYAAPDVTLEADLMRRDLTINAIAQDNEGRIIDPFHGQDDLKKCILRHVSPAFIEDPVRILRVARFMARYKFLGFRIAPETMQLMKTMVKTGEINALVPERVWHEFALALVEPSPQAFIKTLYDCGALAILFPVLQELCTGFNKIVQTQNEPNGLAGLEQAAELTGDPQVRFATLLCHFGKDIYSPETGIFLIRDLCQKYRVPHSFSSLALITARWHLFCHRALELDAESLLNLLEKTDAFRRNKRFKQFLLACEADYYAFAKTKPKIYLQKDRLLAALAIAKSCFVDPLLKQGLSGEVLGKRLKAMRIEALANLVR
jgi:tRNA nucleotidyltransferase (CCA-adding enzyme)